MTKPLADTYADLARRIRELEAERDAIKAQLVADGRDEVRGDRHVLRLTMTETSRLDTAAIRRSMGDNWLAMHSKTSESIRITVAAA